MNNKIDIIGTILIVLVFSFGFYAVFIHNIKMTYIKQGLGVVKDAKLERVSSGYAQHILEIQLDGDVYNLKIRDNEEIALGDEIYVYISDEGRAYLDNLDIRKYL